MFPTACPNKCVFAFLDAGAGRKMRKKPGKPVEVEFGSSRASAPVLMPLMAHLCLLLVISSLTAGVQSLNTVRRGETSDSVNDINESDSSIPPIKAPLPPLINKCCSADEHYELSPDGRDGKCVPGSSRMMSLNTAMSNPDGQAIWEVLTANALPDYGETTETVPDDDGSQTTTLAPSSAGETTGTGASGPTPFLSTGGFNPVKFRLKVGHLRCSGVNMIRKLLNRDHLVKRDSEEGQAPHPDSGQNGEALNDTETYMHDPRYAVLTTDGALSWLDEERNTNTEQRQEFCIDQLNEPDYIALICKPLCNDLSPCIRKCCPPDHILDLNASTCVRTVRPWNPFLYTPNYEPLYSGSHSANHTNYHYMHGIPVCPKDDEDFYEVSLREEPLVKMYALANGSLLSVKRGIKFIHDPGTYCLDGNINYRPGDEEMIPGPEEEPVHHSGSELDVTALICFPTVDDPKYKPRQKILPWRFPIFAICSFVTSIFLFLTAIVYIILWEQQNIHGWLQFAYVVSCLQSYMCLAVLQVKAEDIKTYTPKLCEAMGSVIHFSFLAAFFWMTSMNFDLWWTFSGCSPMRPRSKSGEIRRFCLFALFSWGCSGIIAGTGLVLDHQYRDDPNSKVVRPHFGEEVCYFDHDEPQLYYFYGPMGVLLLINLVFFLSTVFSLHKLQKVTKFATEQSSKSEKRTFLLFIKLFVVMGVLWIFEVIGWMLQASASPDMKELWVKVFLVTDILNSSQGVPIFIIFTCKKNTCRQIEGQLKKFTLFLQQNRDKGYGSTARSQVKGALIVVFASFTLPIVHMLRIVLNYFGRVCGRKVTAGDTSGKTISSNATIVTTSSMLDKSRKISDCSVATNVSSVSPGGEGPSSSNASSITNIEINMTSIVSLKT